MLGAVQLFDAFHRHHRRADAADFRAHFDQAFGQIDHFGFDGAVFQHGGAFGQRGGHQQVFGAADGNHVHQHARAFEFAARFDIAVFDNNFGAHGFEPF